MLRAACQDGEACRSHLELATRAHLGGGAAANRRHSRLSPVSVETLSEARLPPHRYKALYCPTWRDDEAVRLFPFADRDHSALQATLEVMGAVVFVRTHPNEAGRLANRSGRLLPLQGDYAHCDARATERVLDYLAARAQQ